jgi:hypothetical protein
MTLKKERHVFSGLKESFRDCDFTLFIINCVGKNNTAVCGEVSIIHTLMMYQRGYWANSSLSQFTLFIHGIQCHYVIDLK